MILQTLRYGDEEIRYQIQFVAASGRKITIHVEPAGTVRVEAPEGTPLPDIKQAVRKRIRWLAQQLVGIREQQREVLPRLYASGESHFYLGRRYVLKVLEAGTEKANVKMLRGMLQVNTSDRSPGVVKRLLWSWYVGHAREVFERRLLALEPGVLWLHGQTPSMKLLVMKKQWGSCSPQGRLILNPHLVKAPRECIDYVILHELCHLREHNHSPAFYRLLSQLMPDWETVKRRLDGMAEQLLNA